MLRHRAGLRPSTNHLNGARIVSLGLFLTLRGLCSSSHVYSVNLGGWLVTEPVSFDRSGCAPRVRFDSPFLVHVRTEPRFFHALALISVKCPKSLPKVSECFHTRCRRVDVEPEYGL